MVGSDALGSLLSAVTIALGLSDELVGSSSEMYRAEDNTQRKGKW